MERLLHRTVPVVVALFVSLSASAQFKVVGPAPYSSTVARQKIKMLLAGVDAANRPQTVDTLSGLLAWYRDILDEELIAAWKKDARPNLAELMEPMADGRVASGIVEFSWRERRGSAFDSAFAPMFANLMARFPESAHPFLDDLLAQPAPVLSQPEAETVCRTLMDLPDVGTWRKNALDILPRYRRVAESLLLQDLHGSDKERSYQAQRWLADLRMDTPASPNQQQYPRRRPSISEPAPPPPAPLRSASPVYSGPKSGILESNGGPIPQNAEYVFRNVPLVKMQLDYDTQIWDARLAPGDGVTQRLIVKNKSSGPQKRCLVHWSVIP